MNGKGGVQRDLYHEGTTLQYDPIARERPHNETSIASWPFVEGSLRMGKAVASRGGLYSTGMSRGVFLALNGPSSYQILPSIHLNPI